MYECLCACACICLSTCLSACLSTFLPVCVLNKNRQLAQKLVQGSLTVNEKFVRHLEDLGIDHRKIFSRLSKINIYSIEFLKSVLLNW